MTDQWLRVRALLDAQFVPVVVALLVVTLAGTGVAYATLVDPGTEQVERTASTWGTESEFSHRAVVTEANPLFDVGSTLSNRSTYFAAVSPRFEGEYRFSYRASERGDVDSDVELAVVMRGVDEAERGGNVTVLWERSRPLESTTRESLEPGETVAVPFSVNATALASESEAIEEGLGEPADGTQLFLRATVHANGSVNGEPVDRAATHRLGFAFDDGTYRVAGAGPETESFERTETVARERSFGPLRTLGGPLLVVVGLAGLLGLAIARRRDLLALSAAEREYLTYVDDREQFDEWISTIRLPAQAFELPEAEASSLGSLVDFAIDTDNGVMESPDEDAFYVVHDGYLYAYRPPVDDVEEPEDGAGGLVADTDAPGEVVEQSDEATATHPRVDGSGLDQSVVDDLAAEGAPSPSSDDGSEG
ncbi:DUF5305 domain-containing protein [Halorubellus sp. JP-L1]|uniref:DUF5305 domain-containing protein n=1 Tax=Halorubellus sp. JP-L1 TaxID=2715753 RepID=UPI00140D4721|nr:DUF5305 domain-containing protein [Halorubellus sp. JP-L1]NHN40579.1 DUF5305 domain-containing protein [Halorubellus sp. JP-L1]